jgi:hypothetical protein
MGARTGGPGAVSAEGVDGFRTGGEGSPLTVRVEACSSGGGLAGPSTDAVWSGDAIEYEGMEGGFDSRDDDVSVDGSSLW